MSILIRIFVATVIFIGISEISTADTLYRYNQRALLDGRYGHIAKAQESINAALMACGEPASLQIDGRFGPGTRSALHQLARCPGFAAILAADADARGGALTDAFWAALALGDVPTVDERAHTLMLTYEDTDYTRMEWNYCQSRPFYRPSTGQPVCYSNDPHSYLTWGPNGATAGGGREVQHILHAVDVAAPGLIDRSFSGEAAAVRRMFRMSDGDAARSLESYLCGIWANTTRRSAWKAGFSTIGSEAIVRKLFDDMYKSSTLDGGKIATFVAAYAASGLTPTEADYGFFKDRAAHTTVRLARIRQVVADAVSSDPNFPRWKVRQAIALNVRPSTQRTDRLGRDVAFYIDGAGDSLSREEVDAWTSRGRLRASDVGLSDDRSFGPFNPGPAIATEISDPAELSAAERAACPQAVLETRSP